MRAALGYLGSSIFSRRGRATLARERRPFCAPSVLQDACAPTLMGPDGSGGRFAEGRFLEMGQGGIGVFFRSHQV